MPAMVRGKRHPFSSLSAFGLLAFKTAEFFGLITGIIKPGTKEGNLFEIRK